ncbi:hypothetical protein HOY80DRAFT_286089 [Tuber brumale]|nr:hypothetical protein HOY80DRAFT_286089 [Tuber brumale]
MLLLFLFFSRFGLLLVQASVTCDNKHGLLCEMFSVSYPRYLVQLIFKPTTDLYFLNPCCLRPWESTTGGGCGLW